MQIIINNWDLYLTCICGGWTSFAPLQMSTFYTHLTDCKRSLRINCEFCQMDTKLYNMNISKKTKLINNKFKNRLKAIITAKDALTQY